MEFGGLLEGAVWLLRAGVVRAERLDAGALAIASAAAILALVIAGALVRRRRRHSAAARAIKLEGETLALKQELRLRLAEPSALFDVVNAAPTLGASAAFEGDIERVADTLLREAGGRRAKAKELLRRRLDGEGAAKLNGSEAAAWRQLGALSLLDSTGDALMAYSRAADLAPDDPQAQMLVGVLNLRAGKLTAAEAAFRRQIALGNGGGAGAAARYRGHTMLGDVHAARQQHGDALAAYEMAQQEVAALLEGEPGKAALQRDLSVTCDRIGDMHAVKGDLDAAFASYRRGLDMAEALAAREPHNAAWQHDLSVSYDRIGNVLAGKGDREAALERFRTSLAIAIEVTLRDPANLQWQWDLSASHERVGDMLIDQGKLDDALKSYRTGIEIAETLIKRDAHQVGWQRDLAVSYHKIGLLEALRGDRGEARDLLEKGRRIIARLERIAAHQAQWRSDLSRFDAALETLDS